MFVVDGCDKSRLQDAGTFLEVRAEVTKPRLFLRADLNPLHTLSSDGGARGDV